jgi:hypothetical protein
VKKILHFATEHPRENVVLTLLAKDQPKIYETDTDIIIALRPLPPKPNRDMIYDERGTLSYAAPERTVPKEPDRLESMKEQLEYTQKLLSEVAHIYEKPEVGDLSVVKEMRENERKKWTELNRENLDWATVGSLYYHGKPLRGVFKVET